MDKNDVMRIRDEILTSALPHVPFDGWTWAALERGAVDAGHDAALVRAVFPGGIADALDGFADLADRSMLAGLADVDVGALRVRDRVRAALLARYRFLEPYREALRQSVCYWAVLHRKARGAKILWRTADRIWGWAGDSSTDYNRYTKRALLCGVITSTTLAWLDDHDKSRGEDAGSLQGFIDRRIGNVLQFGKFFGGVRRAS